MRLPTTSVVTTRGTVDEPGCADTPQVMGADTPQVMGKVAAAAICRNANLSALMLDCAQRLLAPRSGRTRFK
jgi:hypothetical protein